jgi:hypothetical protein
MRRGAHHWPNLIRPKLSACVWSLSPLFLSVFRKFAILLLRLLVLVVPASGQPVINEFMAQNGSVLADEDGDYSDWIEIHNPTAETIDLAGWHLSDRADDLTMWTFPAVTLEPGAYLLVFASNKDRRVPGQPLHTNFALSAAGEYLALTAPGGVRIATEFSPSFPAQIADFSYGFGTPSEWVRLKRSGTRAGANPDHRQRPRDHLARAGV